jgi:tetratricopeptide (TPR) repeat protein
MPETAGTLERILLLVAAGAALIFLLVRALKRSEDQTQLIVKWILTVLILAFLIWKAAPMSDPNTQGIGAFDGIILTLICGVALAALWRRGLASIVAKPMSSMFDGGDHQIEPRPLYSIAQAKRKRGHYVEAAREIQKQLRQFPGDIEGQLLLAAIQAENLNDLPGAEVTLNRLCQQRGLTPGTIALVLNTLADWHLKFTQDRDAAREDLERIIALLPDSEAAALAAQRIAHLASSAFLLAPHDVKPIALGHGTENVGLLPAAQQPAVPDMNPESQAAEYVKHLEQHPLDTEARENLALLYADHYERLDLAADQLEQLIAHPAQPARNVVRWLNLLADLQVRHSVDYDTIRHTIQRIIDLYPGTGAAGVASSRLGLLRLELKAKQKSQTVKLGSYEQDIGLKSSER